MGDVEGLYGWLRNITCYILFMSILDNLLPGKKYGKYLKLFAGMVLILLVVQPLTGGLRLEERLAHYYEAFVFRYEADDLKQELIGMENQRLEQMIAQYEEAVAQDLTLMAGDLGLAVRACRAVINREQGTEQFGMVQSVYMEVALEDGEEGAEGTARAAGPAGADGVAAADIAVPPVEAVEPVEVAEPINPTGSDADGQGTVPRYREDREKQEEERTAVAKLRRKIASYYNLEEAYVEIQVVEGQG